MVIPVFLMKKSPPQRAIHFLRWFCKKDYLEEIEGDLCELFERQCELSPRKANRKFYGDVLSHFRPEYIRAFELLNLTNYSGMFKNYLKVSIRSLWRQKLYSFINIGGLSVGLCCFILIYLYVQNEYSFDRFYEDSDQVYRVIQKWEGNEFLGTDFLATTSAGLAPDPHGTTYPEVQHATTFSEISTLLSDDTHSYLEKGMQVDNQYFKVFPTSFIRGNPETALQQKEGIILTASLAKKIFPNENPLGKSLTLDVHMEEPFTVTGLIEDLPTHSSLQYEFLISIAHSNDYHRDQNFAKRWYSSSFHTFFRVIEGTRVDQLQLKLQSMIDELSQEFNPFPFEVGYFIQPLSDLHLETRAAEAIGVKGNARYLSLFSLIAVLVLFLACVNYINLAVARMMRRGNEVGVRKTIGARKKQIIAQFMSESLLYTLIAFLLALLFASFLSPFFSKIVGTPVAVNFTQSPILFMGLLVGVALVGLISGIYPAFIASSMNPILAIQTKKFQPFLGVNIQRALVIGQYTVSIALIIGSLMFYKQFRYIQDKELGYNKEHVVTIPIPNQEIMGALDLSVLKNEWLTYPDILSVTTTNSLPTNISASSIINHDYSTGTSSDEGLAVYRVGVNYDFFEVFDIQFITGRTFSPEIASDTISNYIINETAARALNWSPMEAIGNTFKDGDRIVTVVGVVKDFHMHSMHKPIEPLIIHLTPQYYEFISVKMRPTQSAQTLDKIKQSLAAQVPYPLEFVLLDDVFNQLYLTEIKMGEMLSIFTILAILIASMGLFGLAALSIDQRSKEVSIRKVLGASVLRLTSLVSLEFLKMVFIGFLIAIPIAWYAMNVWLEGFSYKTKMEWWVFLAGGFMAIVIATTTVISQSIKAARANPVQYLSKE